MNTTLFVHAEASISKQALADGRKLTIFRVVAVNIGLYDLKSGLTAHAYDECDRGLIEQREA